MLAGMLAVAMRLAVLLALTMARRFSVLLIRLMRSRSTAAPPSASFPSGVAGRRIRSLIHVALLVTFVSPQVAGFPHL